MSTFLSITEESSAFDREQNSKWFAVKCIATIGSPNEGELLNMERLINGERNWTQSDDNYNTLFSSKFVCVKSGGQGVDFNIYPKYWTHTRTRIHDTNVYDYYFTLYYDWTEYSIAYIEAQTNNYISTSYVGFYTQHNTSYYQALELYSYGTYYYLLSLLTYDSSKWGLSINASMPLEFNVEPNNIITAYYDIVVKYQDHNYLYVAFNTSNNWLFNLGGIFGVQGQPTDKLLDCVVVDSTITEDGDARTTTIKVKLTGDRDTIVDILDLPYPQGLVLLANHLMLNAASTPLTSYIINDSTPIITLPTTTQYNRGDITLSTNIAIVDSNTAEQNKVEYNTASIVYTLTDATDESVIYTGVGTWSGKTAITDPEQGAMQDNTINVLFSNIPIGEYVYKVVYTYSDGNIHTAEMTINVIALTLSYFGVNHSQHGFQLNRPISLYFIDTTGSSTGTKPGFAKMRFLCVETEKSFERYVYLNGYYGGTYIDLRPILPNYFDVNNIEYHIKIYSILYNIRYEEYDTTVDEYVVYVNDATHRIRRSVHYYNGNCNNEAAVLVPQILEPLQGFTAQVWLPVFARNQRLFKNSELIYRFTQTLPYNNGGWYNIMLRFDNITTEDIYRVLGLWGSVNDVVKPLITTTSERVMVRFNAPENVEMPTFAMILEGVFSEPIKVDIHSIASLDTTMYDVNEKMILAIPQLTNQSIFVYKGLLANQNLINVSNGGEWVQYHLNKVTIVDATEGYNNGVFRIELTRNVTTKKYIVI